MKSLSELQDLVYKEYVKNGFRDNWESATPPSVSDIAELGLVVSELAEAMEAVRKETNLAEELADTMIRLMNFAKRKGIDLEKEILAKHDKNMEREFMHGVKA